jgi:3-phenylpropionate/trans-cinnamate dioxygenase ferredoxin reductase subunit
MSDNVVIIGAGQAGAQTAISLRQGGFTGSITMLGDEAYAPYERPPLSKAYLAGELEADRMIMRTPEYYIEQKVDLRLNTSVSFVDKAASAVELQSKERIPYDWLVFATGGRVRRLTTPNADLDGIHYLRTIGDVHSYREQLTPGLNLVIVGGGYIGLEVAAVAIKRGCKVTVLEMLPMVLNRVVHPVMSEFYTEVHRAAGVDVRVNTGVTGFLGTGRVTGVQCGNETIKADMVIVGIGIQPNVELAADMGIKVENGIVVDEMTRTDDPRVLAVGDCANQPSLHLGMRVRIESVPNALGQGRAAASVILGKPAAFTELPWFWSDQYDLKLQMAGMSKATDEIIIRGDMKSRKFSACYLRDGALVCINTVNQVKDFMQAKALITKGWKPDPVKLADTSIALKDMAASAA